MKTMPDDKLKNEGDEKVIDFLKDAVAYLENRIAIGITIIAFLKW